MTRETLGTAANELREAVVDGWKLGRTPLFIIGAGCTPIELNQYIHAEWSIRSFRQEYNIEYHGYKYHNIFAHDEFEDVGEQVNYLQSADWFTIDRPYQALFFSDLKLKHAQMVWQIFCRSFLFDWICQYFSVFPETDESSPSSNIPRNSDIYKMYNALAEMVKPNGKQDNFSQYSKGHILTTNYDGALPEYIRRKENNCSIVSDINGIKMLPLSLAPDTDDNTNQNSKKSPFITVLRGDVYHSICNNKLCSSEGREVAVYNLIKDQIETAKCTEGYKNELASRPQDNNLIRPNTFNKLYKRNADSVELRIVIVQGVELQILAPQKITTAASQNNQQFFFEKFQNVEEINYDTIAKANSTVEVKLKALNNKKLGELGDKNFKYKWNIQNDKLVVFRTEKFSANGATENWVEYVTVTQETLKPILDSAFQLERSIVEAILQCPECGESRTLNISFPGLEQKEMEIADTMEALWSVLGNSISLICSAGFSGNSDREVVNYLVKFAEKNKCKWFNVGRKDAANQPHTAVQAAARKALGDGYVFLPIGAKGLTEALAPALKDDSSFFIQEFSNNYTWQKESSIQQDGMWVAGDSNTAIPMQRGDFALLGSQHASHLSTNKARVVELRKDFMGAVKGLHDELQRKSSADIDIVNVSQLALKAFWWNPVGDGGSKKTLHNRFKHSLGVMRVADAWFRVHNKIDATDKHIDSNTEVTKHVLSWLKALRIAALLHDTGHIVFSHLMEEVFQSLNWSFHPHTSYSHEQLSIIRAKILLGSIVKEDLCLTSEPDVSNDGKIATEIFNAIRRILESETGIAWLDAILNSPLDADKIDYVFRDQKWLEISGRLQDHDTWLSDFLSSMRLSSQGQIFLDGRSSVAAYNLLSERTHLYDTLYFSPKVRVLERITGEILKLYFKIKIQDVLAPEFIHQLFDRDRYPNRSTLETTIEYFGFIRLERTSLHECP